MLYIKNGEFRDSKKFLRCADGRTIFNASPEQWAAEGWEVYSPEPEVSVIREVTLEEVRENQINDARGFFDSAFEAEFSKEDRIYYRQLAQDLLSQGLTSARIFLPEDTQEYDLELVVDYFKQFSLLEFRSREILQLHISNLQKLNTKRELENYDYTADYPALPNLRYARR